MSGALEGIRVLDVGQLVQGPQGAALMSDMGADVVKIELPGIGDLSRWIFLSETDSRSAYLEAVNRGKRSATIDLRTPSGAAIFKRLASNADVVISNGVINLVADKAVALAEINRVLKVGGVLQFADIANGNPVPEEAMRHIDLWTD